MHSRRRYQPRARLYAAKLKPITTQLPNPDGCTVERAPLSEAVCETDGVGEFVWEIFESKPLEDGGAVTKAEEFKELDGAREREGDGKEREMLGLATLQNC